MSKALVFAEVKDGKIKKSSLEILTSLVAQKIEVIGLLIGHQVQALAKELGDNGVASAVVIENSSLENYTNSRYAVAMQAAIQSVKPEYVFASHTPLGRDMMALVAGMMEAGLASDCNFITFAPEGMVFKRPIYAGKAYVTVEFCNPGLKLVTVRPNSLPVVKNAGVTASVQSVPFPEQAFKVEWVELLKGTSLRPDVAEASIIISGGRSLKTAENFQILEKVADLLGAAVGASRAAVDGGLRPHRDQVGQTGKVVSPLLYIACGISGAIQHLAGMRTSKVIVAINSDPEAPIYQIADYGVVGDLFVLLPLLMEELKKLKE